MDAAVDSKPTPSPETPAARSNLAACIGDLQSLLDTARSLATDIVCDAAEHSHLAPALEIVISRAEDVVASIELPPM